MTSSVERDVETFNARVPVGSTVMFDFFKGGPRGKTVTTGEARAVNGRFAKVPVSGIRSPIRIARVLHQPWPDQCWRRVIE